MTSKLIAAVEAGGTKFRAAVYNPNLTMHQDVRIPTTTPAETFAAVLDFLRPHQVAALGIASFGPLVVDPNLPNYGAIAATPKPDWSGAPILAALRDGLNVPTEIQTDVEAAAVAELRHGAGVGCESNAYVTVGTGIGVGVTVDGVPFRGRDHLEIGHMPIQRHPDDDFGGTCPFHADCLEGMACGPAMNERWGTNPTSLQVDHKAWDFAADYLAQLACVITWTFSPDRILFSGGVGARSHLAPRIAAATTRRLAGYSVSHSDNDNLVATAELGNDAGLTGAAMLGASLL